MHTISKLMFPLFLTIFFPHPVISMEHTNSIMLCNKYIPQEIVTEIVSQVFSGEISKKSAHYTIMSMNLVNKRLCTYINSPEMTRMLINAVCNGKDQDLFAKQFSTPGMNNYFTKNNTLYNHIHTIGMKRINKLYRQGADVNYYPHEKKPLLLRVPNLINKTEKLLRLGANPNVIFNDKTPLKQSLERNNVPISLLILAKNPTKNCLPTAVLNNNTYVVEEILRTKKISNKELTKSIAIASEQKNSDTILKKLQKKLKDQILAT